MLCDYEDLPEEVLLRIFMQTDQLSLFALRRVSRKFNAVVLDTPLGIAWEYAIKLAKSSIKHRHYGLPIGNKAHTGVNVGGTILNLLCNDYQYKTQKKPKLDLKDDSLSSLVGWMRVERHKRAVLDVVSAWPFPEDREEALHIINKIDYELVGEYHPERPVMHSKFSIPTKYLSIEDDEILNLVFTVEWDIHQSQDHEMVSFHASYFDGDIDWTILEYRSPRHYNGGLEIFAEGGSAFLWHLVEPNIALYDFIRLLVIIAMAGYLQESHQEHLQNWWIDQLGSLEADIFDLSELLLWEQTIQKEKANAKAMDAKFEAEIDAEIEADLDAEMEIY